jgi:spore maturation protein CgeB
MRILILDTCYPEFLAHHYASSPGLDRRPYADQWQSLMDTFFGTADAYSHYLRELGHEAHEVVVNCEPLQRAWADEHGLERGRLGRRGRLSVEQLVAAEVEDFEPDVLYVQNLGVLDADVLRRLGQGRLLVGQSGTELPDERQLRAFDLLVTSLPPFVEHFRELGLAAECFRIGFDPRTLERVGELPRDLAAVFVGSLVRGPRWNDNSLLEHAAARLPLEVWGIGESDWAPDSALRRSYRGEAWGLDMLRLLARARLVLNRHGSVTGEYAANMRLYEATGMGALLLTEEKRNLDELFLPGAEVVAYRDEHELVELAAYYLAHEDERAAIAAAGQARTLRDHTYAVRMRELADILAAHLR